MRLRPGQVRDSVIAHLQERGEDGATLREIHDAVNRMLGKTVSGSSVRSYLNLNLDSSFERIERGHYRLRSEHRV